MTYNQNFVAVIKSAGKILREVEPGLVSLPFKSEYSILLKNLNSKRALVTISIDGQSIGNSLIIEPNSTTELERFIGDRLDGGHRFKFIEKTKEIVEHRGDRIDDGMIRIEVKYEKDKPVQVDEWHHHHNSWDQYPWWHQDWTKKYYCNSEPWSLDPGDRNLTAWVSSGICNTVTSVDSSNATFTASNRVAKGAESVNACYFNEIQPVNDVLPDEGITVKGSHSNQNFCYGLIGALEENAIVIILRLRGYVGRNRVVRPVTVKSKQVCSSCGKHNKSNMAFCGSCGTSLT